ncbi:site-2 protease family protein [Thermicanus aegyptius]|uniref:site-2 protease family protein n=1 Tax=Thermicanus aegyptius TaxID=94009 RepID=UPI0005871FEA|nr:site-2 protease family protein [Thermicanus aegyptius]
MNRFLAFPLELIPYVAITLVIAFTVHEFAHAWTAYLFGDPTAKNQGRLTLNPLAHLDPIGTILIFIAGFGWAKPVPVNRFRLKRSRWAGVLISLAGPASNLLLAIIGLGIYLFGQGVFSQQPWVEPFFHLFIYLNVVLFVFNLLPLPPLDGYRIIEDLVPTSTRVKMSQYEPYGAIIFLILVLTPLDRYTIQPLFQSIVPWVMERMQLIYSPFFGA